MLPIRKGFVRLSIVFVVMSCAIWGGLITNGLLETAKAEKSFKFFADLYEKELRPYEDLPIDKIPSNVPSKEAEHNLDAASERMWAARRWLSLLLWLMVAWFVAPPILVASGVWIYKGFKISN